MIQVETRHGSLVMVMPNLIREMIPLDEGTDIITTRGKIRAKNHISYDVLEERNGEKRRIKSIRKLMDKDYKSPRWDERDLGAKKWK